MSATMIRTPRTAATLIQAARFNRWYYSTSQGRDRDGNPIYRVSVAQPTGANTYTHAVVIWHWGTSKGTPGLYVSNAVIRDGRHGQWRNLTSLRSLVHLIHAPAAVRTPGL